MVKLSDFSEHIQKSFITSPEIEADILASKIKNKLKDNLTKGLIDEDTFKKAEEQLDNLVKGKKGEGTRGGHVIGHTKSGKPVYAGKGAGHKDYEKFSPEDHSDAARFHQEKQSSHLKQESNHRYGGIPSEAEKHKQLASHHSQMGVGHSVMAGKKLQENMSADEKKILADQKKKQIEHHEKQRDFHEDVARYISSKHSDNPNRFEARKYHMDQATHHNSEKERLENEKKGY